MQANINLKNKLLISSSFVARRSLYFVKCYEITLYGAE